MSIVFSVFFKAGRLPALGAWSKSARQLGFELTFPEPYDLETQDGFMPVECSGIRAGFEFGIDPVHDYLEEADDLSWLQRLRIRRFAYGADLTTHSRFDDHFTAIVASAALTHASGGLLMDWADGRFVPARRARAWVRKHAVRPDPTELERRDRIESMAREHVAGIIERRGFERLDHAPGESATPDATWFARSGSVFTTEMMELMVSSDADETSLRVSFFGSRYPLEALQEKGLTGNAGGQALYIFHDIDAYNRPNPPLPPVIKVDEDFPDSDVSGRLEAELDEADPAFYRAMWQRFGKQLKGP